MFLVTSSVAEAGRRTKEVASIFGEKKLFFNPNSLEILPSVAARADKTPILLSEGMEFSWVQVLVALGCYIDSTGSTEALIKGRLEEGWKMFAKLRPMLCCPKIPEEERIKAFYTTVASCVLWGAGCWSPSTSGQQLLSIQFSDGSSACWVGGSTKTSSGWYGCVKQNARPMR